MWQNSFAILTVTVAIISQRWHIEARLRATQSVIESERGSEREERERASERARET